MGKKRKKRRPRGFFTNMNNEEILGYAKREHGNEVTKGELQKKNGRLYEVIRIRKLLGMLKSGQRSWKEMSDDEILEYTWETYGESITRGELQKKDKGLYEVIRKRELLWGLESGLRWVRMSNDEVLEYTWKTYGKNITRGELQKKDKGLYNAIWKRKLNGRLKGGYKWRDMSDDEILEYIWGEYGRGITGGELSKEDSGLYQAIRKRNLTDRFKGKNRSWKEMSNDRILEYTWREHGENVTSGQLAKKDSGLYEVIRKRKLTGRLKIGNRWARMRDDELIDYAKREYGEDVTGGELSKKDSGLYQAIWKRELLDKLNSSNRNRETELEGIVDQYIVD